jgi:cell division protease FtsH
MWSRSQFKDTLAAVLGGRAAEELIFGEITTGAQDDLKRVTDLARRMVTDFGMSDKLGLRTFGDKQELVFLGREISEQKDYSERFALEIDKEVNKILEDARGLAKKTLSQNKPKLVQIAERLIVKETLDGEELEALFVESVPSPETQTAVTPAPAPAAARTRARARPRVRKAPVMPRILPKQTPATPD